MAEFPDSDASTVSQSKSEVRQTWSEELDRLPLKQRLKILLANNRLPDILSDVNSENDGNSNLSAVPKDVVVQAVESEHCDSEEKKIGSGSSEQSHTVKDSYSMNDGELKDCNQQVIEVNQMTPATITVEKVNSMGTNSLQQSLLSKHTVSGKVVCSDKTSFSSSGNYGNNSSGGDLQALKIKPESPKDFFDDLDHVTLIERRRLLLSSQKLGLTNSSPEGNSMQLSSSVVDSMTRQRSEIVKEENRYVEQEFRVAGNHFDEIHRTLSPTSSKCITTAQPSKGCRSSKLGRNCQGNKLIRSGSTPIIQEKGRASSLKKNSSWREASIGQRHWSSHTVKVNPALKVEPLDDSQTRPDKVSLVSLPFGGMVPGYSGLGSLDDSENDKLDHMLLRDRMKLLSSAEVPHLNVHEVECSRKAIPSASDSQPQAVAPECVYSLRNTRARKRRKTATDSVETALEEDAPGLLQVLMEKGVSVDEIKLYAESESDEALDDLPNEDNFTELEAVISNLFSQRNSLLKLVPLRCTKGEKATYCLACLFSLVEQARYLQFRKWPIEWGWCRDLQSFIFVFERHNRIVLERPEYGYATYFFELVDCLPIDWQIKRLVIAMKLTSCSRVTLIENRALVTGEDLSEGEAKVLMEYGWVPNTGLGSMLNYCDRVVHDSKNEKDSSEWRSKIGKLLVDGYNGGTIVPTDIPRKVEEYNFAQSPQIKLELI